MAKGRKGTKGQRPVSDTSELIQVADLQDIFRSLEHSLQNEFADEALDRAQEKAFDAMEATSRAKRIALAKEALAISPLCSDGHYVLGLETRSPQAAVSHFRDAVKVGAEALGERAFKEDVGDFWGLIETRPYMRALHMLALTLWQSDGREEAIGHYREMLRLNPNDNQGIRYLLLEALLELGRDAEAAKLWRDYKDDASAVWAWSNALIQFRSSGESTRARSALEHAIADNPYVPAYLTGQKPLPRTLPDYISFGGVDEAVAYVAEAQVAWVATDGALSWVKSYAPKPAGRAKKEKADNDSDISVDAIDQAVLSLLYLNKITTGSAWKGFDWDAMNRLYDKGFISDPVKKAKSVVLTDEGIGRAEQAFRALFAKAVK